MIALAIALIVVMVATVFVAAMCRAAADADDRTEALWREHHMKGLADTEFWERVDTDGDFH